MGNLGLSLLRPLEEVSVGSVWFDLVRSFLRGDIVIRPWSGYAPRDKWSNSFTRRIILLKKAIPARNRDALAIRPFSRREQVVVPLGRSRLTLGGYLVVALLCARGNALDPNRHISQYGHTVWRVGDGAIDPTSEITQTADGYVWLGSPNGLLRFDGVKFVRYAPPGLDLPTRGFSFLLGARDGSLWVGMRTGFGRLKDGKFQWYSNPAQDIGVYQILEDHEGTIWVTRYKLPPGEGPLCRVEGNRLHCFGEADGIPIRYGLGLTEDKSGDLWFGSTVLCRWRHGSTSTYLNEIQKHRDS